VLKTSKEKFKRIEIAKSLKITYLNVEKNTPNAKLREQLKLRKKRKKTATSLSNLNLPPSMIWEIKMKSQVSLSSFTREHLRINT